MADPTELFSVAEARAFNATLANETNYPTADITAAEARIRADFAEICGVYFIPTSVSEYVDGDGNQTIMVSGNKVSAVTACVIYNSDGTTNETLDATDLTDLAVYPIGKIVRRSRGYFPSGSRNVYVTYTCGFSTVPPAIKRAALQVCVNQLIPGNTDQRMTSMTTEGRTWSLATAGRPGQWYGLPEVDSALQRYNYTLPAIA